MKKVRVLFSDAKPLQNTPERNCHFFLMSKGMNGRGQTLTVGKESRSFKKHIKGLKARVKRWPDAGDSCDVNRARELRRNLN